MQETLSRETLSQSDKAMLEKLLAKGPMEMSQDDAAIIRARRVYLTAVEREIFADVLEIGEPPESNGKAVVLKNDEMVDYSRMTNEVLIKLLEKRKISIPETVTIKKGYIALLEEADKKERE